MWINLKLFKRGKKDQKGGQMMDRPDIDEEYKCSLRTNSYANFLTKLQSLEFGQETINSLLLQSPLLSSKPRLKELINNYFDASEEASRICSRLLDSISQIQVTHQAMHHILLDDILECNPSYTETFMSELKSFAVLENPFSDPTKNEFRLITEKQSSLLLNLKHKSKKMSRKIKIAKFFNKATFACLTLVISAATTAFLLVVLHTFVVLLMGPVTLLTLPFKTNKNLKKKRLRLSEFVKTELMKRLRDQVEMAAKGTYILNRDFDTMSRLVVRLSDEVDRNKAIARFCLERKGERFEVVQEVLKEIKRSQLGMRNQADELQEHVCLSLVTINRARELVIREIVPSS